ncbi:peptidylprolyl isomerase [Kangiella sp. HD9-110m-PIT-SAG07]|nr:peptidylprolyl isomerase [Kangiella sp. HD9-110m-PIT-SAG07]
MKHGYLAMMGLVLGLFSAGFSAKTSACVHPNDIYYWADMRDAEHFKFDEALNCDDLTPETLEITLISLGRIGGDVAVKKIRPYLKHKQPRIREAAAFALGIAKEPQAVIEIITALESEPSPQVQYRLALALGNMGHKDAQTKLTKMINQEQSIQKVRGAIHGLMLLATFHKDQTSSFDSLELKRLLTFLNNQDTQLETSYLLARTSLLNSGNLTPFLEITPELSPAAKANLIRALAKTKQRQLLPTVLSHLESEHIGVRVNAIRSLANYTDNPVAIAGVLQALSYDDVISQVTALQTIQARWLKSPELLNSVNAKLHHENSWVQSEALQTLTRGDEGDKELAKHWLESKDPNHQRAAITYFVKQEDEQALEELSKSNKAIIANGAKQALKPEPEIAEDASKTDDAIPELPAIVELKTIKGTITIKLFADTPYTSANFIELVEKGFYNNTYFHRVIPNFVAQGGSKVGDGSGNVDYSIREELSYRSHLPGTVGMATLGKDTGGAQFFINTAPNLHLDSNYTIFGKVIDGMGVAIKLEQNDKVISAKVITD